MAKYEIEFPVLVKDGVEYEPTGEFRCPKVNDWYLLPTGPRQSVWDFEIERYPILRRKQTPLERLKAWREHYQKFRSKLHNAYPYLKDDPNCESLGAIISDLEASK